MACVMPDPLDRFPPTRAVGLQRLAGFVPRAGEAYAVGRNTDVGPEGRQAVSELSPWLRHRLLTEREVVSGVLERHDPRAAQRYIQEVLWRTYWKGWLQMNPAVWTRYQTERDAPRASGLAKAVAQAEAGATGIEGFDDWARELVENGYLHNHARMWFASIWIFTLGLPWAPGADFFEHPVMALGGGTADRGQDLSGDDREHPAVHGGPVQPEGTGDPSPAAERRPSAGGNAALTPGPLAASRAEPPAGDR